MEQRTSLRLACVPKVPEPANGDSTRGKIGERLATLQRENDGLMNKTTGNARKAPQRTVTATVDIPKPTPAAAATARRVVLPLDTTTVAERQNVFDQVKRHVGRISCT